MKRRRQWLLDHLRSLDVQLRATKKWSDKEELVARCFSELLQPQLRKAKTRRGTSPSSTAERRR